MDVAKALGITLEPALDRNLWRTQMDMVKTSGITLEPVLHRCLHKTQMDTVKTVGSIPEALGPFASRAR